MAGSLTNRRLNVVVITLEQYITVRNDKIEGVRSVNICNEYTLFCVFPSSGKTPVLYRKLRLN